MWFPDWPLRRPDAPSDRPCQVVGDDGLVTATDPQAAAAGVRSGMRRREAEAICPTVITLEADSGAEAVAFEPVVMAVEALVPRVEVARPGLLFVPVAGAVRYYGGEGPLADRVLEEVERVAGHGGRIGLADGPFAAHLAARRADDGPMVVVDTVAFLDTVDVAEIGVDDLVDTFRWLGITTLGALRSLPRVAVASRFGPAGLESHRVASGEDRALLPRSIPADIAVEDRFDPPLLDLERAAFAARALAGRLLDVLVPLGGLPHRVVVEAFSAAGDERTRTWRSAAPFTEAELAERIRWQLRAWVESGGIPGGITRIRLVPADLSDQGRQLRLGQDATSEEEARRAIIRAQGLVGPDAVLQAGRQGGREPGEQVRWHRWGEEAPAPQRDPKAPWPGRIPAPSPTLVPPDPLPLDVDWDGGFPARVRLGSRWVSVLSWAGPWRATRRWWDGEAPADRFQIVTSAGAFLCEVREEKSWLTGIYD